MGRLAFLLVSVGVWAGLSWGADEPAFRGYRPVDTLWPEDREVRIEWRDGWDATYAANKERWAKELERLERDRGRREGRLRLRLVRLLEALAAKYPGEADKRIAGCREIADHLVRLGLRGRANYVLRTLVDESPGRADLAAWACTRILEVTPWDQPHGTAEGRQWVAYAARRVLALHRAGHLPASHPAVAQAQRAMVVAWTAQGRWMEAAELLGELAGSSESGEWRRVAEAELFYAAGRSGEALRRFQGIQSREFRSLAAERVRRITESGLDAPPTYPGAVGMEVRWEALRGRPLAETAGRLLTLVQEDAAGGNLVAWGEWRHTSLWAAVARHVSSLGAEAARPLREAGAAAAARRLDTARRAGTVGALLAVYRRHPWSAAGHRALLEYGEAALRRGQAGLALRAFRDVASHASDAGVRARAQVGLWLARAQEGLREALDAAFEGTDPEALYPWMGRPTPAQAIWERLLAGAAARPQQAEALPLSGLELRAVRTPPVAPWPWEVLGRRMPSGLQDALAPLPVDVRLLGGNVVLGGPQVLCGFGRDPARPRWIRAPRVMAGVQGRREEPRGRYLTIPGTFRPAVAGGRLVTRWGLDSSRRHPTAVAAFDAASGEMRWSTAGDPAWEGTWPVGDPAVADGRVYVLAVPRARARVLPVVPIDLVCLDAERGTLLWRQWLASQDFTLTGASDSALRDVHFDLVHYGNAVTVHDGAVYCSTNLGFVARCDARDGLVEWTRAYRRVWLGGNVLRVLRRLGSPPMVAGGRVIFAPRDQAGAFAVERETGRLLWDSPFVASDEVVGRVGGTLLLRDVHSVAALDVATGRTRWHRRFDDELLGRPALAGRTVVVSTRSKLQRLAADTGRLLDERAWGADGPMRSCVVSGRVLAGLAERPAAAPQRQAGTPLNRRAPAGPVPLRLPLKKCWTLRRPNPRLIVPPPEAKLDGKVYVLSHGTLECVRLTARGAVEWQRPFAPGFSALAWAPNTILFVYPRRVTAVDASTGDLRWETDTAFPVRRWTLAGPYLVLRDYDPHHRGRRTAVVEVASGKLLWDRSFRGLGSSNRWEDHLPHVGWDGKNIHVLGHLTLNEKGYYSVVCRPTDGRVLAVRRFLPKGQRWPEAMHLADGAAFAIDHGKVVRELSLTGGEPRAYRANLRDLNFSHLRALRLTGQWLQVHHHERERDIQWVLRRGDPAYELRRDRPGDIRGDLLYEPGAHTLTVLHLPTKRQRVRYTVPATRGFYNRVLHFAEQGDTMLVVSGLDEGPHWQRRPARLRIDTFDRRTGQHRAGQVLDDVPYWTFVVHRDWRDHTAHHTQAACRDGVLVLTDLHGLHAFTAAPRGEPAAERPARVACRRPRTVRIDGTLDEWDTQEAAFALTRHGDVDGRLRVTHDDANFYVAVACTNPDARPRRGRGHYGSGDWLELGITVGTASHRLGMGLDDRGRVVWEQLGAAPLPQGIDGQVGGHPATRQMIYELAIPLKSIVPADHRGRLHGLGLSVAVWDEQPAEGTVRTLSWGTALMGHMMVPLGHERIVLHPLTREAEAAGLALVEELPDLPTSWAFFEGVCRIHASDRRLIQELHRRILKRHPRGQAAQRALVHLDQMLRTRLDADPCPEILKLAEQAGVARDVRDRYARLTRTHLSQWIHIDPKSPPGSLMLQLYDRRKRTGGEHRVFWGDDVWHHGTLGTPSRRDAGGLPPAGAWHELRIPLIWLGLHDTPVHGIGFHQRGGHNVVWDRTAFVGEGKGRILIDDKLPEGRARGSWHWVGKPVRSGAKAHTEPRKLGQHSTSSREVHELKSPVVEHLLPPLEGPYLSQWVTLDRADPPKMVALRLHDGRDWRTRHVWGEPHRDGHTVGPLPQPGAWHELRLPLARTGLGHQPIRGIAFAHVGGRVLWDRTAIVANGRQHIVIDDEMPEGQREGSDWEWVGQPVKSGTKAHTQRPSGGYRSHGVYRLEKPIVAHMPFTPEQAVATLAKHIPHLGPTDAAWHFFEALTRLDDPDPQRRIDRHTWFLRHFPTHARGVEVLARLLSAQRAIPAHDPFRAVEAIIAECRPPRATRYAYRRRYVRTADTFVRTWQLLGPFPNPDNKGFATPFPAETEPIGLTKEYEGAGGKVRWKAHTSPEPKVGLKPLLDPSENVVGYAVCWLHSDRRRTATIELGSDDGCKLWLNRKLLLSVAEPRPASPRQNIIPVTLPRGWSELLIKVAQGAGEWEFYLELIDPEGLSLLPHLRLTNRPPRQG